MTATLTDFLLARLDEDEAVAREAIEVDPHGGRRTYYSTEGPVRDDWGLWTFHVDPVRALADVAAKRAIVEEHPQCVHPGTSYCETCERSTSPCRTLRLLAQPYAEHPDYRPEWRAE